MTEPRKLNLNDLRAIVTDGSELAKGAKVFDDGGLSHLARFEHKLFADAKGSGASPYKVQVLFEDKGVRGRCSCMAARSRPFCKHASGLLVAWARSPESFAVAAAPPAGAGEGKKKAVKKGKVDAKELMARGVEQVSTLIRELAVAGVASLGSDRAEQVRALGASLRESKLRRLSARTLELAGHLEQAASRSDDFDGPAYAELLGDVLLTARKLEKHIAGEALANEHVEELIGKTWTKKDRIPVEGLELLEYGFITRTTSDDFLIRESRFVDLATGEHYAEKQILPAFLVKRTPPKPSWAGKVLAGASGSLYPSFAPRRVDLESTGSPSSLEPTAIARLLSRGVPSVSAALAALAERRKDIFAPEALPILILADTVVADGPRLQLVDADDAALFLFDEGDGAEVLARVLRDGELRALIGDVALDGVLPTLYPLSAIVERDGVLALETLGRLDASAILESKKIRSQALMQESRQRTRWIEVARRAGASPAAISLGEVREEMAHALASGLSTVNPRFTDPLATRLRELSLGKQAELLSAVAARQDPAEKLEDFIKLHQVLGIALARLAGAARVQRTSLEPVRTHPSVHVKRAERHLEPAEIASGRAAGRINRYEAAMAHARYFDSLPAEALASAVYPMWADGSVAPYVIATLSRTPEVAIAAAKRVLDPEEEQRRDAWGIWRSTARVAKLTAIELLARIGTDEARRALEAWLRGSYRDPTLIRRGQLARARLAGDTKAADWLTACDQAVHRALNGSLKDERIAALRQIGSSAFVPALPVVRAIFRADISREVREEAAYTLAHLGDVESVESLVELLRNRAVDPEGAKVAARALGILGDVRGLDELLRAWADSWHPAIVTEAIKAHGHSALEPIVRLIEESPDLVERKAILTVVAELPARDVADLLLARLDPEASTFFQRASLYLGMLSRHPEAAGLVALSVSRLKPAIRDKKNASAEERALAKKCAKYL